MAKNDRRYFETDKGWRGVRGVQFKERILDKYDIACELVAFSNSHGGKLVVGIKDKTGETNALSYSEVQETTNLLIPKT